MLYFKGSLGQVRISHLNKSCTQVTCVAVAHLSTLWGWRSLECKFLLCFLLHLLRRQVLGLYPLHPPGPTPAFSLCFLFNLMKNLTYPS